MPPRGYEEEHPSVERHRHRGIARGGTYGAMLTAKAANFDGRYLPRRFYRCGLPSECLGSSGGDSKTIPLLVLKIGNEPDRGHHAH